MSNHKDDIYKYKAYNDCDYSTLEGVPLIHGESTGTSSAEQRQQYPGNRRTPTISNTIAPADSVLVRTAGNALQAVPSAIMSSSSNAPQIIAVHVPGNAQPGDTIHVRSPYDNNQLIAATIPPNVGPGMAFYVQVPSAVVDEELAMAEDPRTVIVQVEGIVSSQEQSNIAAASTNNTSSSCSVVVVGQDVIVSSNNNNDLHLYDTTGTNLRG
jgi:hypothetical protein